MSDQQSDVSVLVVDDDDDIRYAIGSILKKCDCTVVEAVSVEEAQILLASQHFQIVFCDMRFHGGAGGETLLEFANQHCPETEVVLISCAMDEQRKKELVAKGASICLQKPFFRDTCLDVLSELNQPDKKAA